MRNRYPGPCRECGAIVDGGQGYFERYQGGWRVRCIPCTAKAKHSRGADLTPPQLAALTHSTPSPAALRESGSTVDQHGIAASVALPEGDQS